MDNVSLVKDFRVAKDFLSGLIADLPQQFKDKPHIEGLLYAIGRQFEDLSYVNEQLRVERWLSNAVGRQLDGIGDIVQMSRVEAAALELRGTTVSKMADERYKDYLAYKMFLNASWCTRDEIMRSLRFFFDKFPLYYTEDPAHPATILIETPTVSQDFLIQELVRILIPKPAGVQFWFKVNTVMDDKYDYSAGAQADWITEFFIGDETPIQTEISEYDAGAAFDVVTDSHVEVVHALVDVENLGIEDAYVEVDGEVYPLILEYDYPNKAVTNHNLIVGGVN